MHEDLILRSALVARGTEILTHYGTLTPQQSAATVALVRQRTSKQVEARLSYRYEGWAFHSLQGSGTSIQTFVCMADLDFPRGVAFQFLQDVSNNFSRLYGERGNVVTAQGISSDFQAILRDRMDHYNRKKSDLDKLSKTRRDIDHVKEVVFENFEKLIERGDAISDLLEKTELLVDRSFQTRAQPSRLGVDRTPDATEPAGIRLRGIKGGILTVLCYLIGWLGQAEVVQKLNYDYVLFFMYIRNSLGYGSLLIIALLWRRCSNMGVLDRDRSREWWYKRIGMAFCYSITAFTAGYLWLESLSRTSLVVNIALNNSTPFMALLLSTLLLPKTMFVFKWWKLLAVLIAMAGIGLIAWSNAVNDTDDDGDSSESSVGVPLVLLSSALVSIQEVLWKRWGSLPSSTDNRQLQSERESQLGRFALQKVALLDSIFFLGLMGFFTLTFLWPLLLVFDAAGWESLSPPTDGTTWGCIIGVAALDTLMVGSLLFGALLSSPVFVMLGGVLSIPLAVILDVIESKWPSPEEGVGAGVIVLGFVVLAVAEWRDAKAYNPKDYRPLEETPDFIR